MITTQLEGGVLLKMLTYFEYVNIFEYFFALLKTGYTFTKKDLVFVKDS